MKNLILLTTLASMFSISAFAAQTKTECPMMRSEGRNNPKANLLNKTAKQVYTSKGTKVKGE